MIAVQNQKAAAAQLTSKQVLYIVFTAVIYRSLDTSLRNALEFSDNWSWQLQIWQNVDEQFWNIVGWVTFCIYNVFENWFLISWKKNI